MLSAQHGLYRHFPAQNIFVPGIHGAANPFVARIFSEPLVRVSGISKDKVMCALDLCSGTGSSTRVLEDHGYKVTSVDVDAKWVSTKVVDFLNGV